MRWRWRSPSRTLRAYGRADSSRTQRLSALSRATHDGPSVRLGRDAHRARRCAHALRPRRDHHSERSAWAATIPRWIARDHRHQRTCTSARCCTGELLAAGTADRSTPSATPPSPFDTPLGNSILCSIDSARSFLTLPSTRTTRAAALSAFLAMPRPGDSLLVFDPRESHGSRRRSLASLCVAAGPGRRLRAPAVWVGIGRHGSSRNRLDRRTALRQAWVSGLGAHSFFRQRLCAVSRHRLELDARLTRRARPRMHARHNLERPYLPFASGRRRRDRLPVLRPCGRSND